MSKPPKNKTTPSNNKLFAVACWIGIFSAVLSGFLVLTIIVTVAEWFGRRGGELEEMGLGIMYFFAIPVTCVPVGILSLVGWILSRKALRQQTTKAATIGYRLSVFSPLIVVSFYAVGVVLIMANLHL